jgi:flagellar motility protein MotE (MotC chaperone)
MPEYSTIPIGLRIFVLILIIILLLMLGFFILNSLGIVDMRSVLAPIGSLFNIQPETKIDVDDPMLLAKQRLAKDYEAVDLLQQEVVKLQTEVDTKSGEVNQQLEELAEKEKQLEEREKLLNQQLKEGDDRRRRLEQMSKQFSEMPPKEAVDIMSKMNVQEVIDIMKVTEELAGAEGEASIVPYWLSLMKEEKAAEIQEKWR